MDVVPDQGLLDFLNDLGKAEDSAGTSKVATVVDEKEKEIDVWQHIATALEHWTRRILDTGSRHITSGNFRQTIEESLRRQQLDGFLTAQDITELRWVNLLNATSCYTVGCVFVKREIISYLLELYSLRQFTSCVIIETCLKL